MAESSIEIDNNYKKETLNVKSNAKSCISWLDLYAFLDISVNFLRLVNLYVCLHIFRYKGYSLHSPVKQTDMKTMNRLV